MVRNKLIKKAMSLGLVCVMLAPIASFAIEDTTAGNTDTSVALSEQANFTYQDLDGDGEYDQLYIADREEGLKHELSYTAEAAEEIDGHVKMAENSGYELFVNQETLSIIMRDKSSGALVRSCPEEENTLLKYKFGDNTNQFIQSGVSITLIEYEAGGKQWKEIDQYTRYGTSSADVKKTFKQTSDGFTVDINYTKFGISFTLNVSLDETGLHAEIPSDSIAETNDKAYYLNAIYLWPLLGSSKFDYRDSSFIIPDGNGILIHLEDYEDKYTTSLFSKKYMGSDLGMFESSTLDTGTYGSTKISFSKGSETAVLPVWGVIYDDTKIAFLGAIESGAENAYCQYTLNSLYGGYNMITTRFIIRDTYQQKTARNTNTTIKIPQQNHCIEDIKVTYLFASGDDANYANLATQYRDLLIDNGTLVEKDCSYKLRTDFFGSDKENFLFSKRSVVMTSAEEVKSIIDDLSGAGVKDLLAIYRGWQKGGIFSLPIKTYKADGSVGGTDAVTDLAKNYAKSSVEFALVDDAQTLIEEMSGSAFIELEMFDGEDYEKQIIGNVFDSTSIVDPQYTKKYIKQTLSGMKSAGFTSVAMEGITANVFSYKQDKKRYYRYDTINQYGEMLKNADADFNVIMKSPNIHFWKYASAYTDVAVESSNYVYADEEIPFLTIVLKGSLPMYSEYVNFEADKTDFFLKLIEYGVYPSFYLTKEDPSLLQNTNSNSVYSSRYDLYKDEIVEYYESTKKLADEVEGAKISNHEILDNDVHVTTYDNGVVVYVNYSDSTQTVDGVSIESLDYKVGEAND